MLGRAEFFAGCLSVESYRLNVLRLAKYSNTPVDFFMEMQAQELGNWFMTAIEETQREKKEIEKMRAQADRKAK